MKAHIPCFTLCCMQVVAHLPVSQGCGTSLWELIQASGGSHQACAVAIERLKQSFAFTDDPSSGTRGGDRVEIREQLSG